MTYVLLNLSFQALTICNKKDFKACNFKIVFLDEDPGATKR